MDRDAFMMIITPHKERRERLGGELTGEGEKTVAAKGLADW